MKAFSFGLFAMLALLATLSAQARALYLCKDMDGTTRIRQVGCLANEISEGGISQTTAPDQPSVAKNLKPETPPPEVSDAMQIISRSPPNPKPEIQPSEVGEQYITLPPGYSIIPAGQAPQDAPPQSASGPRESYVNAALRGVGTAALFFIIVPIAALLFYGWKAIYAPRRQQTESNARQGIMNMNDNQKSVCVVVAVVTLAMGIYPPFHLYAGQGVVGGLGYGWIFSPPTAVATVDVALLIAQWIGVLIIGTIAFALLKDR